MHTIAAYSGGALPAAIGIVRLTGDDAIAVLGRIFLPKSQKSITDCNKNTMIYGKLLDIDKNPIDICLAAFYKGPNTYTGEDMAEIFTHGSQAIVNGALEHAFAVGAVGAMAGEFTKRAFLNGKLDLSEAEAVADLIYSKSRFAAANALCQLEGHTKNQIEPMRQEILGLLSHFYAVCDYPDEDIEPFEYANAGKVLTESAKTLSALCAGYKRGAVIKEGLPVAVVGRPNVGKSSLFNALSGQDRAIVTPEAGTTRDVIEQVIQVDGGLFRLLDTAGLRAGQGIAENIGIERSIETADSAQAVICVFDGSQPLNEDDLRAFALGTDKPRAAVINKSDLPQAVTAADFSDFDEIIFLSAKTLQGVDNLETWLKSLTPKAGGGVISSPRQAQLLWRATEYLQNAAQSAQAGATPDAFLADAEAAVKLLGEVTGETASSEIVDGIFSRFCVGK